MFTIVIAAALLGLTLRMIDTLAIVSMLCILLRPARFAIILAVRFAVRELASAEAIMIVVAVVSAAVAVMIAAAAIMVVIAPPMIAVVIVIPATARYESCQKDTEAVVHATAVESCSGTDFCAKESVVVKDGVIGRENNK